MQHILAFSQSAVVVRHWFEINLDDASMEHGARIELRALAAQPHRGSESAAQLITADRPLWRADLFDRLADQPGSFQAAHYHPQFSGNEPCARVWDPELTADPWRWLHDQFAGLGGGLAEGLGGGLGAAASEKDGWPLDPEDARELSGVADAVVAMVRQLSPDRCRSVSECFQLTRDARESVQLMIKNLRHPDLLDADRVAPWRATA